MLTQLTVRDYVAKLASGEPTPGGGSGAALAGALGAALGEMVGNFTVGKEKFAAVENDVRRILDSLGLQRVKLLELTDADAGAYAKVGAAYAMPRETDDEKAVRKASIEEALKAAAEVPLAVTDCCLSIIQELDELEEKGNPNLLSDVAVSAELALAALRCAWLNVEINLASIKDEGYVGQKREIIDRRLQRAETSARAVFDRIAQKIRGGGG